MRVLISTFGFEKDKILDAMRNIAYDKLILIIGKDALEREGYKHVKKMESYGATPMETIVVDVFNFNNCFDTINEIIEKYNTHQNTVTVNISGGTKLLADSAMLAAYQHGVETYHCEKTMTKLPIIKGITISDRFTENQCKLMSVVTDGDSTKDLEHKLRKEEIPLPAIRQTIRELKKLEILWAKVERGIIIIGFTDVGRYFGNYFSQTD